MPAAVSRRHKLEHAQKIRYKQFSLVVFHCAHYFTAATATPGPVPDDFALNALSQVRVESKPQPAPTVSESRRVPICPVTGGNELKLAQASIFAGRRSI